MSLYLINDKDKTCCFEISNGKNIVQCGKPAIGKLGKGKKYLCKEHLLFVKLNQGHIVFNTKNRPASRKDIEALS